MTKKGLDPAERERIAVDIAQMYARQANADTYAQQVADARLLADSGDDDKELLRLHRQAQTRERARQKAEMGGGTLESGTIQGKC